MFNQLFQDLFPLPNAAREKLFARFKRIELKKGIISLKKATTHPVYLSLNQD